MKLIPANPCWLYAVKRTECRILMNLMGGAVAVYQQLSEERKENFGFIKEALLQHLPRTPMECTYNLWHATRALVKPLMTCRNFPYHLMVGLSKVLKISSSIGCLTMSGSSCVSFWMEQMDISPVSQLPNQC